MKTFTLLLSLTIFTMACEKEKNNTCICQKTTHDFLSGKSIVTTNHPITDKKKKAENRCDNLEHKPRLP